MTVRVTLKAKPSQTDHYSLTRVVIRDGQVWFEGKGGPPYEVERLEAILALDIDVAGGGL